MNYKEKKAEYNKKYNKTNYKQYKILIRKDDKKTISHLEKQKSINKYIKELIEKDIKCPD